MVARKNGGTGKRGSRTGWNRILIIIGIGALFMAASPYAIERWIHASLDYNRIKSQTEDAVRARTGLGFASQGLRFHIFRGIVFNGARFFEEKSDERIILARSENLILEFSLIQYLRGRPPITEIRMDAGRLILPAGSNATDMWRRFQRILRGPAPRAGESETPPEGTRGDSRLEPGRSPVGNARYLADQVRFSAQDVQIHSESAGSSLFGRLRLQLEATMPDPQVPGDLIRFRVRVRTPEDVDGATEPLDGRGEFTPGGTGRFYFTVRETPVTLLAGFFESTALLPVRLTGPAAPPPAGIRLRAGRMAGKGSFDVYPDQARQPIGLNFEGSFTGLEANLHFAGGRLFEIHQGAGRLRYNGGFETEGESRHFTLALTAAPRAEGPARPAYHFDIEQRDIAATAQRRSENYLALRGYVQNETQARCVAFDRGRLDFDLRIKRDAPGRRGPATGSGTYQTSGHVRGTDIIVELPKPKKSAPTADSANSNSVRESFANLELKSVRLEWDAVRPNRPSAFTLQAEGHFLAGALSIAGDGNLDLMPTADGIAARVFTNLELRARSSGVRLEQVADALYNLYQSVRQAGLDPESRRAEDAGPLWQNKFFETPIYKSLLENLRVRARLDIRDAQPRLSLPPELSIVGRMENGYLRLESENGSPPWTAGAEDPAPGFQLKYESNLQAILPRQDLQVQVNIPQNRLGLQRFTADRSPPESLELRYQMGGDGVFSGDLMQRTYSRLEIQTRGVRFGRRRIFDIIRHEAGLPGDVIRMDRLSLIRSTDGSKSNLRLQAASPEIVIDGQGENLAGIGGELLLRFRFPADPQARGDLRFRIRADDSYVPEL
jgi:hypothetical protein